MQTIIVALLAAGAAYYFESTTALAAVGILLAFFFGFKLGEFTEWSRFVLGAGRKFAAEKRGSLIRYYLGLMQNINDGMDIHESVNPPDNPDTPPLTPTDTILQQFTKGTKYASNGKNGVKLGYDDDPGGVISNIPPPPPPPPNGAPPPTLPIHPKSHERGS